VFVGSLFLAFEATLIGREILFLRESRLRAPIVASVAFDGGLGLWRWNFVKYVGGEESVASVAYLSGPY
jgi:hypothetical protein